MDYYDLTNLSNVNDSYQLTVQLNTLSGFWLGNMILLSVWVILFLAFKTQYFAKDAILGASFITAVVGGLLWALQLIGPKTAIMCIFLVGGSIMNALIQER